MLSAVGHMSCLECGYRWEVEALLEDDSAYVILDDLCPECEAQGEPAYASISPNVPTLIEGMAR
jgi:hypothetical protein